MGFENQEKEESEKIYVKKALVILQDEIKEYSQIKDNSIEIPELQCNISLKIGKIHEGDKMSVAYIIYHIMHAVLDEPIYEIASGAGKDADSAVKSAVLSFAYTVLDGFLKTLRFLKRDEKDNSVEKRAIKIGKKEHRYSIITSDTIEILSDGQVERRLDQPLYPVFKGPLEDYIGCRKIYWAKAYCSKLANGRRTGEFRINEYFSEDVSASLKEHVKTLESIDENNSNDFLQFQQYVFVIQDEETYTPYPYTKEEILEKIDPCMKIYNDCFDADRYYDTIDVMNDFLGDEKLAQEFFIFFKEIAAEIEFAELWQLDSVGVFFTDGDFGWHKKSQFTPYMWIKNRLMEGFEDETFSQDLYDKLIAGSATLHLVELLEKKQKPIEEARGVYSMFVRDGYELR